MKTLFLFAALAAASPMPIFAGSQTNNYNEIIEEHGTQAENTEAAFECAALASRWNWEEQERLLQFAYQQGQKAMTSLIPALGEGDESDWESVFWEETHFKGRREFIAFQLGQMFGRINERFFRDIPYGESRETWDAAYKRRYENRNCALIGR